MKTFPIEAGMRVKVFDNSLYVDDKKTPLIKTMQPATVIRRYMLSNSYGGSSDVCDVRFDHDGRESNAHFTNMIQHLD